jgi:hypothetical protein
MLSFDGRAVSAQFDDFHRVPRDWRAGSARTFVPYSDF